MIQNQKRKIYSQINLRKTFSFLAVLVSFLAISIQTSFGQYQKTQKAVYQKMGTYINAYYESLPVDYASNTTKKYPILIFIHGKGELGDGSTGKLPLVLRNGPPKLLNQGVFPSSFTVNGETNSFIVISPQINTYDYSLSTTFVNQILSYCLSKYRVDEQRIYITGLSMGGMIGWRFIGDNQSNAEKIAASVLVCSGASNTTSRIKNIALAKSPVWLTNNSGDPVISAAGATAAVTALNAFIPTPPKSWVSIFTASGHDAWTKTYDPNFKQEGLNVYQWLLSHKLGTVTPPPATPIANAGSNQVITLPTNSVTLDGSKSTAGSGTITNYTWSKVSGPAATISSPTAVKTTVSGMVEGSYTFNLTVKNSNGNSASATVAVTVNGASVVLKANAGGNQTITLPTNSVTVDGSRSTYPSGSTFLWRQLIGPPGATISSPTSLKTNISGLNTAGDYQFQLQITDKNGNLSTSSMHVIVNPDLGTNTPLKANAGANQTITLPANSVTVDGSSRSTYPSGSTFLWRQLYGPPGATISSPTSLKTIITGLNTPGDYQFQLRITDKNGNLSTSSTHVIVEEAPGNVGNTPLHADAGPNQTITLPESDVKLNGSANSTAPEGSTHTWSQTAGPVTAIIAAPWSIGTNVTGLTKAGTYQFKLELKDKDGNTDAASMYVYVKSAESTPVIPLHADAGPNQTLTLPVTTVKLDGSENSTAPPGSTHTWSQSTGPVQTKIAAPWSIGTNVTGFTVAGTYSFRLLLKDADGNEDVSYVTITVKSAASARTMGSSASDNAQSQPVQAVTPDILTSSSELEVKINPNPVQSTMNIWISGKPSGKTSVLLYDLSGKVLLQQDFVKSGAGTVNKSFSVSKLAPGTYIAQIIVDNQFKKTVKFLKQ